MELYGYKTDKEKHTHKQSGKIRQNGTGCNTH